MYPICPIYRNFPIYSVCPMYLACPMYQMNSCQQIIRNSLHGGTLGISPTPVKAKNISLEIDGKKIEIMNSESSNKEINKALQNPTQFQEFKKDPKEFLKNYNLDIDEDISKKLSNALKDVNSVGEISPMTSISGDTTVWAISDVVFSFSNIRVVTVV